MCQGDICVRIEVDPTHDVEIDREEGRFLLRADLSPYQAYTINRAIVESHEEARIRPRRGSGVSTNGGPKHRGQTPPWWRRMLGRTGGPSPVRSSHTATPSPTALAAATIPMPALSQS